MKKYLLLCLAAGLFATGLQAQNEQKLVVHLFSGDKIAIELAENPVTTFAEDSLVITTADSQWSLFLAAVRMYTYESQPEGVDAVNATELLIRMNSERLEIEGLADNTAVKVYSLDGKQVEGTRVLNGQSAVLNLTSYPAGTYIINAGGTSYKFVKQ